MAADGCISTDCSRALRFGRAAIIGISIGLIVVAVEQFAEVLSWQAAHGWLGGDLALYRSMGAEFLASGHPYTPDPGAPELSGQFRYPPPAVLLFAAFTILPWPLWWAVPICVTSWVVSWWRPAIWYWPLLAGIVSLYALTPVSGLYVSLGAGNTDMWVVAVIALATRWPVASWLLVAKPTALLFTLPALRTRGWWLGIALAALPSLALWPLWFDWLQVLPLYRGTQGPVWLYGLVNWPLFALPWLAKAASRRDGNRRSADKGQNAATMPGGDSQSRDITATAESFAVRVP